VAARRTGIWNWLLRAPNGAPNGPGTLKNTAVCADTRSVRRELHPAGAAGDVDSYRRLADVFHDLLSEQSLEALLDHIGDALTDLIPHEALHIYEADEANRQLVPVHVRSQWAKEIYKTRPAYGEGITGWAVVHREAVLANQAQNDPRVAQVPGTPVDPESLIVVPLIARGSLKGTLNIYRVGEDAAFDEAEFELAQRFGDAAALALHNAQIRARLEHQAQTDSLTGLYNHRHFHDRLRAELTRISRTRDTVAVLMLDLDDFKRVNDVHGHGEGDQVLVSLAELLGSTVRGSDVVCRIGGEEFAVILPSCQAGDALGLARRIAEGLRTTDLGPSGRLTFSAGVAEAPVHAMNPRELAACAETSMMSAKAGGGDRIVVFSDGAADRPDAPARGRDARSIAHMKMLQSLGATLARLNDVRAIGSAIVNELRTLIDYHNSRVFLVEGDMLVPIAFRGRIGDEDEPLGTEALACRVGEGITGRAAFTGQAQLVPNVLECEFAIQIPGTSEIDESIAAVPLCYGARTIGVVVVSKLGIDQFDQDDVRLLEVLAGHASVALENARLYENQRKEAERASESAQIAASLLAFSRELTAAEGVGEVAQQIVEASSRVLSAEQATLWLQDREGGELICHAVHGGSEEDRRRKLHGVRYPDEVTRTFLSHSEPFQLSPEDAAAFNPDAPAGTCFVVAPLAIDGRLGCLAAALEESHVALAQRTRRLIAGLADQAKLALQSAESWERLERTFVSTVEALANALEASDETVSSHARWITDAALAVGRELGLEGKTVRRLEYAALLHDIGKIGVPQEILNKPGPLTPSERAVIETHPILGDRILAPIERLADVRAIVRACHERWDGNGYPDGKTGEEIPLEARIILVCDAYHAMVTDRPYRDRLPETEARRRLHEGAGTQFDPGVVDVFLRLEHGFAALDHSYAA
jgi:diguanylate cyclase (GGDEF)-like protein